MNLDYKVDVGTDRIIVRDRQTSEVVMQLSERQIDILETLYDQRTLRPRKEIQNLIYNRPSKYNEYGYRTGNWSALSNAQRASYARSIRRLNDAGLVVTERDTKLGLCDRLTM